MKRLRMMVAALLTVVAISALAADDWRITTAGYGPVRIGMSVEQASRALGAELVSDWPLDTPDCYYLRPEPAVEGLWLMVSDGRIVRIDVNAPGITTRSGAGVGDSEARLKELFPSAEVTPHKYVAPDGNYLTVWTQDRKAAVRFETLQGKVTSFYAGQVPQVEYIEGCS